MAFQGSIEKAVAGDTISVSGRFVLPSNIALVSPNVSWVLLDEEGVEWSNGSAFSLNTVTLPSGDTLLVATCNVPIPTDLPASSVGTRYMLRYTLQATEFADAYSFDSFSVFPASSHLQGASTSIALILSPGAPSPVELTLLTGSVLNPAPTVTLFQKNTSVQSSTYAGTPVATADGYLYTLTLDVANQPPLLRPYTATWVSGSHVDIGQLFIVTPSIMQAVKDLHDTLNKAHAQWQDENIVFTPEQMLTYLRTGMDMFNAAFQPTNFTMTNATGPVRALWLSYSTIAALRAQYMTAVEKAFDLSGATIQLSSDRTPFYESMASTIESSLAEPTRTLKANLSKRGLLSGDGDVNPTAIAYGAIGAIGITVSPVNRTGFTTNPNSWWANRR